MTFTDDVKLESENGAAHFESALEMLVAHVIDKGCICDECVIERSTSEELVLRRQALDARRTTLQTNLAMEDYSLTCAFCGVFTENEGHLLPRTAFGPRIRDLVGTIPTCVDCTVHLFDFPDTDIRSRCDRVRANLEFQNSALLGQGGSESQSTAEHLAAGSLFLRDDFATLLGRLRVLSSGGFLAMPKEIPDQIVSKGVGSIAVMETSFACAIGVWS